MLLPLDRGQKLQVGGYLILKDFAEDRLRLRQPTMEQAHRAEQDWRAACPGLTEEQVSQRGLRKPFSMEGDSMTALGHLPRICQALQRCDVRPPRRVLELGSGHGWLAEALAIMGFDVCATTLSRHEVEVAQARIASIRAKGLPANLEYRVAAMESVDQAVSDLPPFDVAVVYEALHHVWDWRQALCVARGCLLEGGWLFIINEPGLLHPLVSYRMARLLGVQEAGFSRGALLRQLRRAGFREVRVLGSRLPLAKHWLAARA